MEKRINKKYKLGKKAQGLSITTVVLAILAIIILVVLAYLITTGGFGRFNIFGGKANVQDHVTNCQVACTTNSYFDYCEKKRTIVFDDKSKEENKNCEWLSNKNEAGLAKCEGIKCTPQPLAQQPAQPSSPQGVDEQGQGPQPGEEVPPSPPVPPIP